MYPWVESDLWNVHGLNNKISLFTDSRVAWSNVKLNNIAVQDDLDDNTYEYVRRYLALTSFTGGHLAVPVRSAAPDPAPDALADHRHDRRAGVDRHGAAGHSPAAPDQARAGRQAADRRLHDARRLDDLFSRTAQRDNFGTPWGQTMYNWQWYIGDRTSIVSAGWFEFFKLVGSTPLNNNMTTGLQPERPEHHHLGRLDQPAAAGEPLLRLLDHRHRADQDLGGQRVDQLLALTQVVWYLFDVVRLRRRGPARHRCSHSPGSGPIT